MGELFLVLFTNYIAPILGSMIMILLAYAVKKLAEKLNVKIDQEKMVLIESFAEQFVLAAEEKAAAQIKKAGDKIGDCNPKLDKFAEVVNGLISKFPELSREEAEKIVNSVIVKIPGIGVTQL